MRLKTLWITLIVLSVLAGIAGAGNGLQNGQNSAPLAAAANQLTDAQKSTVLFMREEEKLARDVYLTMDDLWDADIFATISMSEQRHMDAIAQIISRYGLKDPVADNTIGVFADTTLAARYVELVAKGSVSLQEALKVGVLVEQADIADLEKALTEAPTTAVRRVFTNLLAASRRHLEAFETSLATGETTCSGLACNSEGAQARGQHRARVCRQGSGCGGAGKCPLR